MKKLLFIIFFLVGFVKPTYSLAADEFVTIVNLVRISYYNKIPVASLQAQYEIVKEFNLPVTWLVTYDVLLNRDMSKVLKALGNNQEQGVLLEITPALAKDAEVIYHNTGSWHFANAVFLSGYTQEERLKLIDKVFLKFKGEFGYYPASVGAWWIDSFSLSYMKQKYGVIASLGCADQYSTDNYQLWGQYWSTPYYPRKYHIGMPASSLEDKLDIVLFQWAPREPRKGYLSSLYSTQDYLTLEEKPDTSYFKKLLNLYGRKNSNQFGQVTIGLEADMPPESYKGEYQNQLRAVNDSGFMATTMKDFAKLYKNKFPNLSPSQRIEDDEVIWYQSPKYRIGIDSRNHKIIDLRIYLSDYYEPYYLWPQREKDLRIYIPSVVDTVQNSWQEWDFGEKTMIKLNEDNFELVGNNVNIPDHIKKSNLVRLEKNKDGYKIVPILGSINQYPGLVFNDWNIESLHILKSPKLLFKSLFNKFDNLKKENYFVSQSELEALNFLRLLPNGKILIDNQECLQCEYFGDYKPAVFANLRSYIGKFTKKPMIYNKELFLQTNRQQAKNYFNELGVKYIYVVKYGSYEERVPFSPGDLGIEKMFENANAQVWRKI